MKSSVVIRSVKLVTRNVFINFCTKTRIVPEMPPNLMEELENNLRKPRHHPGLVKPPFKALPPYIDKAILEIIGDTPMKQLLNEGKKLNAYLEMRHIPPEEVDINEKRLSILREVENSMTFDPSTASEEEKKYYNQVVESKVKNILKQRVYNWISIDYTHHTSLVYLVAKAHLEFPVLATIFSQIKAHDPNFKPKSLFDFGSGVGTAIWAAEEVWNKCINEFYCVDTSPNMADISTEIVEKSGYNISQKVYHRQFLPTPTNRKHDITVSAYSLMELPSTSIRLSTLLNLWERTNRYLVLVERGSYASFKLINEARDFILMNSKNKETNKSSCYIVAPCSHEFPCPKFTSGKGIPCNFTSQVSDRFNKGQVTNQRYTYIVLAKGERRETDEQWPRIVGPVLQRSRHVVCKLCTNSGRLEQITISPSKPNKLTYRVAKASKWGDLLPVDLKYVTVSKTSSSSSSDDEDLSDEQNRIPLPQKT